MRPVADRSALIVDDRIQIEFPYSAEVVSVVREINGRKFDAKNKVWSIPNTPWHMAKVLEVLVPLGFFIDKDIAVKANQKVPAPKSKYPSGLYAFQRLGVDFLYQSGGRAILADGMGLGKTITSLSFVQVFCGKTLVVCPANVVYKWGDECEKWLPDRTVQIIDTGKVQIGEFDVIIMSYSIMVSKFEELSEMPFDVVIFDEAHYLKSYKAQRTRVAKSLVKAGIPKVLFLSGTPFMNRPAELYSLVNMLDPVGFGNFYSYAKRYCGAEMIDGMLLFPKFTVTNPDELAQRLSRLMIRRTKKDVEMDIPDLTRTSVPVELTNKADYRRALKDIRDWLKKEGKTAANHKHVLTRLNVLRQIVGRGKVDAAVELAESVLQDDRQVVLFAHHKEIVTLLADKLKSHGVGIISGDTPQKERQERVKEFLLTDSRIRVMIVTLAGAEGIDLYSASDLIFCEREWVPAQEEQMEGRLQRHGQKNPVNSYYLTAKGTVDEKLDQAVREKRKVVGAVISQEEIIENLLGDL